MIDVVPPVTEPAETIKAADLAPGGIVTEPGTVTRPLLLESVMTAPPAGAGDGSTTWFPFEIFGARMVVGASTTVRAPTEGAGLSTLLD